MQTQPDSNDTRKHTANSTDLSPDTTNSNRLETEEDRQRILEKLRTQYGDQWLEENRKRLDQEWETLQDF